MATNHTEQYGLNLWEPGDAFLREEFNENTQKTAAALSALQTAVAAKGNCQIVAGSYVGTGTYGAEHPAVLDFAKTMGKAPLFVFVSASQGGSQLITTRGVESVPTVFDSVLMQHSRCYITWTKTGLSWYNTELISYQLNSEGETYHYIALFDM